MQSQNAGIAQLVEHDLAKVGVAGSSPVSRSGTKPLKNGFFTIGSTLILLFLFHVCPDGGIGRRAGLKIQWPVMAVPVRFRLRVLLKKHIISWYAFFVFTGNLLRYKNQRPDNFFISLSLLSASSGVRLLMSVLMI